MVRRRFWGADDDRGAVGELGLAGGDDQAEAGRVLLVTSTQPRPSVPVTMSLIDLALLFSTTNSLVTPANRMIDSVGTTAAWAAESVTIVALAKPPGRSSRRSLGTWVST